SSIRPCLEALEDRCVPNIDMVTNLSGVFLDPGSLPFEVGNAAPGDTIRFAANLKGGTINLKSPLDINMALTIDGAGSGITVSGGGAHTAVIIDPGVVATINALTITGGVASGANGGGIDNQGSLTLTNSTVTGNSAMSGGGIYNSGAGTMIMSGDTVNNNKTTSPTGHRRGGHNHDQPPNTNF